MRFVRSSVALLPQLYPTVGLAYDFDQLCDVNLAARNAHNKIRANTVRLSETRRTDGKVTNKAKDNDDNDDDE